MEAFEFEKSRRSARINQGVTGTQAVWNNYDLETVMILDMVKREREIEGDNEIVGKIKTLAIAVIFWSLREHSNS